MGWTFSTAWEKPSALRDYLLQSLEHDGRRVLDHASTEYGRRLWAVVEDPNGERWIFLALIERGGRDHGCGYKDMCETMGPAEVDCPLRFLDVVPDPGGYATEWRERVRAHHARGRETFLPGQPCVIGGRPFTVVARRKRSWVVRDADGGLWRANTRQIQRTGGLAS